MASVGAPDQDVRAARVNSIVTLRHFFCFQSFVEAHENDAAVRELGLQLGCHSLLSRPSGVIEIQLNTRENSLNKPQFPFIITDLSS